MDESTASPDDQLGAIASGARHLLDVSQRRAHIVAALVRAVGQYDTLVALMRASDSMDTGMQRVMELLEIDQVQAGAVMGIQLMSLSTQHHQRMLADYDELLALIADLEAALASPERLRDLVGTERGAYLARQVDG